MPLTDERRRNNISLELVAQQNAVCADLRYEESVHVVVVGSRGPEFSTGGDLDSLSVPAADPRAAYRGFDAQPAPLRPASCGASEREVPPGRRRSA